MRRLPIVVLLGALTFLPRPAAAAPVAPVLVVPLHAPAGRVHAIVTGAISAPPLHDVVLVVDNPAAGTPGPKWAYVHPPGLPPNLYALAAAYRRPLPAGAALVQCGDVTGDGYADLTYLTRRGVYAFAGGAGGLAETPTLVLDRELYVPPATDRAGRGAYVLDLNGDGRMDLLLPVPDGFSVHLQSPGNTFSPEPTAVLAFPVVTRVFAGSGQPWLAYRAPLQHVADFDGDGRTDVAVLSAAGCYLYHQTQPGTFTREQLAGDLTRETSNSFTFALFGDWNADGHPDAGFTRMERRRVMNSNLRVHWGAADRVPETASMTIDAPGTIMAPLFLDATGDGRGELLLYRVHFGLRFALNYFLRNRILVDVEVYRLNGAGTYPPVPDVQYRLTVATFDSGAEPARVVADLNGDGAMDVAAGLRPDALGVFLGHPVRVLDARPAWTVPVEAYGRATVADLNGDGRDDLLLTYPEPERQHRVNIVLSTAGAGRVSVAGPPKLH